MASSSLQLPYITVVGAIVIATVFFFVVAQPLRGAISETRKHIAEQEALLEERTQFLRSLDSRLRDLNANQSHEQRLAVVLPSEERVEDELRIIHQRATAAGLTIMSIDNISETAQTQLNAQRARGEQVNMGDVVPLAFNLDIRGPYQGMRAFLTAMERSPRLTDIQFIRLNSVEPGSDQMEGGMALQFYTIGSNQ